jgi:uncharacterized protein
MTDEKHANQVPVGQVQMRLNPYVRIVELSEDEQSAFYNLVEESLVILPRDLSRAIRNGRYEELTRSELLTLVRERIVGTSEDDERDDFLLSFDARCNSKGVLCASVCVTTECNLTCPYCFQRGDRSRSRMDATTAIQVALEIAERAKQVSADKVSITFTGGEPFLNLDAIYTVAQTVGHLIKRGNGNPVFTFDVTTNGTLLTSSEAEELQTLGLSGLQVTLEGRPKIHDQRHRIMNRTGAYQQIVDNISALDLPTCINVVLDEQTEEDIVL